MREQMKFTETIDESVGENVVLRSRLVFLEQEARSARFELAPMEMVKVHRVELRITQGGARAAGILGVQLPMLWPTIEKTDGKTLIANIDHLDLSNAFAKTADDAEGDRPRSIPPLIFPSGAIVVLVDIHKDCQAYLFVFGTSVPATKPRHLRTV